MKTFWGWIKECPEHVAVFILGVFTASFGILIIVLPEYYFSENPTAASQTWRSTLTHIGASITAVGLLIMLLDPRARKRHDKDICEIRNASAEALLKRLIPVDSLYKEIEEQILKQSFLRRGFHVRFELTLNQENKDYLNKDVHVRYEIKNISHATCEYQVIAVVDCEHEDTFPNSSLLKEITIEYGGKTEKFKDEKLKRYCESGAKPSEKRKRAKIPIKLDSGEEATINVSFQNVMPAFWVYPFVATYPTENFSFTINHPHDVIVSIDPLHPSEDLHIDPPTNTLIQGRISRALLPCQGITITCRPNREVHGSHGHSSSHGHASHA